MILHQEPFGAPGDECLPGALIRREKNSWRSLWLLLIFVAGMAGSFFLSAYLFSRPEEKGTDYGLSDAIYTMAEALTADPFASDARDGTEDTEREERIREAAAAYIAERQTGTAP